MPVTPPSATVACAACVAAKCCDESRACATSADCARATECARGVSAPDVLQYCAEREWPAGARPYAALADCAKSWCQDACAIGADWTCVGSVSVGKANDDRVVGTLTMVDATAQSRPVPGLDVRGCFSTDYTCANPVTPIIATDAMGTVTLSLPASAVTLRAGFIGYFYVTDPSNTYLPEMVFPGNTLTRSGVHERAVASTPAEASMLAALTGHVYDPTHGDVIVTAVDCAGVFAARMSFTIDSTDAETKIIYTYNGFPDVIATDTDATGTAIIGNVPPGAATVRVHSTDLGKDVAVTHILVRAGTVSLVELTPTQ